MPANAIYSTTGSVDWVDAAKLLDEEEGITPRYWINHGFKDDIKSEFSDVIVHDSIDAIQGRFPEEFGSRLFYEELDSNTLAQYREYESLALKMMDRMDIGNVTGTHFTYSERVRHYHRQLSYWIHIVETVSPNVVIFGASPHAIYDFILYAICDQRNIETIIFTHTSLPNRFLVRNHLDQTPVEFDSKMSGDGNSDLTVDLKRYLNELRSEYTSAKPDYMEENETLPGRFLAKLQINHFLVESLRYIRNSPRVFTNQQKSYVKRSGEPIENSRMRNWEWRLYRLRARVYRRKLHRHYKQYVTPPEKTRKYVFFPLHYQPERTTAPEGGDYVHQYLAVKLLADNLPNNIVIYVKEHPSQFASRLKGEQGRQPQFYDDLIKLSNVHLIPINADPFEMIDGAEAVATITGTAGWEALVRGTPAIVFGNAWYRAFPHCYYVKQRNRMEQAVERVLTENDIPNDTIKEFVLKLDKEGYEGSLNTAMKGNAVAFYRGVRENFTADSVKR